MRREWLARPPRRWRAPRMSEDDVDKLADAGGCLDALDELAIVVVVVGVLLLVWFFVLPALIFLADVLYLLLVAAIGVAIRVLFRRPWNVVAETTDTPAERVNTPVVGFRASGAKVDEIAYRIEYSGSPLAG